MRERLRMLWFRVRNWALHQRGMEAYRARYWKKKFEQCEREKHATFALNMGGKPGRMCPRCGYQRQMTRQHFKRTFGKSFSAVRLEHASKKAVN